MSTIGPAPELALYLRSQLKSMQPVVAGARSRRTGSLSRGDATSTREKGRPADDLAAAMARRIAAIDPADPERRRKAFRVFLESLLLHEWGDQLLNDPGFHQLVDSVHAQMEGSPQLVSLIQEVADRLLGFTAS